LLLLAATLAGGCASGGPKPAELVDFQPRANARVAWKKEVGEAKRFLFRPAVVEAGIYTADAEGVLTKFDAAKGRRVWKVETGTRLSGGVGLGSGQILVGTAKGEVLAFDHDGKALWRSKVSSEVLSAPVGNATTVVARSGDSKVFGLKAGDGSRIWEYQAPSPPLTLRAAPGIVLVGEKSAVAGFPGGKLLVLNTETGAVLWETSVATPRGNNELERIADIAGFPLVEAERVCAVTYQGRVGCYETQRGTQVWTRAASSAGSLSAEGTTLYYTEENGSVVALDKQSGASVWKQDKLFARKVSAPLAFGPYVAVGDYEGYVHLLSRDDGSFIARLKTDGSPINVQPVALGERILVQTDEGGLFAIEISERKSKTASR
jgi:outer membrane protein assembly factor BamB